MTRRSSDWLRPLPTDHRRHVDLAPVIDLVGDARVVALGEGAHNIEEFLEVRNDLLRALVTELGFTAIVSESGFAEGLAVDAFVLGGPGDPASVAREAISYRFGECEPAVEQLRWLRAHNSSDAGQAAPAHWYGMDLSGDSTSPEEALRACLSRIPAGPGDDELIGLADLGRRARAALRWEALGPDGRARLYAGIDDVVSRARTDGDAIARHCADALVAFVAESRWSPAIDDAGAYPREVFMADTILWVLEGHERVLVCAHNAHLQRTPVDGRPMAGNLLAAELGDDLLVVGQTYGAGPEVRFRERSGRAFDWEAELADRELVPGSLEHSVEGELADVDDPAPRLVLPARRADLPGAGGFDAVVHHRRVRQVPGAFARLREDLEVG